MPVTFSIATIINAVVTPAAAVGELATGPITISKQYSQGFGSGTGAAQADLLFADQRSVATGATDSLDLAGVLAPLVGTSLITMVGVKLVVLFSLPTNTTNLTVTRPATNGVPLFGAASATLAAIKPGCLFVWYDNTAAGVVVTAGTGDLIDIVNSAGATAVYDIYVLGDSA